MWLAVRVVCVAVSAIAGVSVFGKEPSVPMPYWVSVVALCVGALTMRLWVKPLYSRIVPAVSWAGPEWTANPVSLREPLNAFHLLAICFIALALPALSAGLMQKGPEPAALDVRALAVGAWGLGLYLGVLWVQRPAAVRSSLP